MQSNYPEPSFWIIEPLQKEGNAQSKHLVIQFSFTNICERTVISESSLNWRVVLNVGWGWCLCNTKVCGKSKREEISQSTFKGGISATLLKRCIAGFTLAGLTCRILQLISDTPTSALCHCLSVCSCMLHWPRMHLASSHLSLLFW